MCGWGREAAWDHQGQTAVCLRSNGLGSAPPDASPFARREGGASHSAPAPLAPMSTEVKPDGRGHEAAMPLRPRLPATSDPLLQPVAHPSVPAPAVPTWPGVPCKPQPESVLYQPWADAIPEGVWQPLGSLEPQARHAMLQPVPVWRRDHGYSAPSPFPYYIPTGSNLRTAPWPPAPGGTHGGLDQHAFEFQLPLRPPPLCQPLGGGDCTLWGGPHTKIPVSASFGVVPGHGRRARRRE